MSYRYKPYYASKKGIPNQKSFSGYLKQNARTLTFTLKNPVEATLQTGFTLPELCTYATDDFYTCMYQEWGNQNWINNRTPVTVGGDTVGGGVLGGFTLIPEVGNSQILWNLNSANRIGIDYSYAGTDANLNNTLASGIAVAQASTCSFTFQYNNAMLPSAFWAATTQYGKFKPLDVTLAIVPRRAKPWAAGATIRDNAQEAGTTGQYEGIGQVPNAILQEGSLGGAQTYTNPAFTSFPTRTWYVHIPRNWFRTDGTVGIDPHNTNAGYIWSNWQSWLMFGQTDSKLKIRLDDLLKRSHSAKPTNGGCRVTKRFLQPSINPTLAISGQAQGNLADIGGLNPQYQLSNVGTGVSAKPYEYINIPDSRGYTPGWWAEAQAELGKEKFYQPFSLPMGDFVVDACDWQTAYLARGDAQTQGFYQNFTQSGSLVAGGISDSQDGKPIGMNPPMMWDVYFIPRFHFAGYPCGMVSALLGQS